MQPQLFFERELPGLLVNAAPASVFGTCLFSLTGEHGGEWTVDLRSSPPAVRAAATTDADCVVEMKSSDLDEFLSEANAAQLLAWQGRMRVSGLRGLLARIHESIFGSAYNHFDAYYAALARLAPDPGFRFMNHGYADEEDDFHWLAEADRPWRYAINLIRRVTSKTALADRHVLDAGCGRGGGVSWLRQNCRPASVTGLDACVAAVRLCGAADDSCQYVTARSESLPFASESFDVLLNVESSHCYRSLDDFFSEVQRVLRPGGTFCYADTFSAQSLSRVEEALQHCPGLHKRRDA